MCDFRILDRSSRWPRRYDCARNGKYETVVQPAYKQGGDIQPLTIHVCKQHLNAIERGEGVSVRCKIGEHWEERTFEGVTTELGEAENTLDTFKFNLKCAEESAQRIEHQLGYYAAKVAEELFEAIEGIGGLEDVRQCLLRYRNSCEDVKEVQNQVSNLEKRVKELKEES